MKTSQARTKAIFSLDLPPEEFKRYVEALRLQYGSATAYRNHVIVPDHIMELKENSPAVPAEKKDFFARSLVAPKAPADFYRTVVSERRYGIFHPCDTRCTPSDHAATMAGVRQLMDAQVLRHAHIDANVQRVEQRLADGEILTVEDTAVEDAPAC